jgi:hypothetical protein
MLDGLAITQTAHRALLAQAWEISPLRVCMAPHTGVVDPRDGDCVGPPLNRLARLLAAGHGGQVLLTRAPPNWCVTTCHPQSPCAPWASTASETCFAPNRSFSSLPSTCQPITRRSRRWNKVNSICPPNPRRWLDANKKSLPQRQSCGDRAPACSPLAARRDRQNEAGASGGRRSA